MKSQQNVLWPYTDISFWISVEHVPSLMPSAAHQRMQGTFLSLCQQRGFCKPFLIFFGKTSPVKSKLLFCLFEASLVDLACSRLWGVHTIPSICQSIENCNLHRMTIASSPGAGTYRTAPSVCYANSCPWLVLTAIKCHKKAQVKFESAPVHLHWSASAGAASWTVCQRCAKRHN